MAREGTGCTNKHASVLLHVNLYLHVLQISTLVNFLCTYVSDFIFTYTFMFRCVLLSKTIQMRVQIIMICYANVAVTCLWVDAHAGDREPSHGS